MFLKGEYTTCGIADYFDRELCGDFFKISSKDFTLLESTVVYFNSDVGLV